MGYSLEELLNTPTIIIEETLNNIDIELSNGVVSRESTTPFHMLLESSRMLAKDSLLGTQSIIRRKFPSLASSSSDVYLLIHNDVKDNLFAIPGTAPILFYVNVLELKQYGINENGMYKMTIPATSTIVVKDVMFTLLNDIEVSLKDNGTVTVEQINNDLDIAVNDIGILSSAIISDNEGVEWILFETNVKNISKTTYSIPIIISNNFVKKINLNNKFSTIYVSYENENKVNNIKVAYSDEYLDEKNPTAIISLTNNTVSVYIPDIYLMDKDIEGILYIDVYETNGNLYLPLNQLKIEDYILTLNNIGKSEYAAISANITMFCTSRGILNNGIDNMSFDKLKSAVIDSTLGDIDLPVSNLQIKRKADMYGYQLDLVKDTLFTRLYIANKALPEPDSTLIQSKPDLYFNKVTINLDSDMYNDNIKIYNDAFIIKHESLFKYDNNGKMFLLSNVEYEAFKNMTKNTKIEYLKNNKLFYTPFTYVVKYDENITSTEVYYLKPNMDNIRILKKNFNILQKVNTKQYGITKTYNGYKILTNIATNDELLKTDMSKLRARLVFNLYGSTSKLYFDSNYNTSTEMFEFNIETAYLYDNLIELSNGTSILVDRAVELNTKAYIYIYSVDDLIVDSEKYLINEFGKTLDNVTILTKESIDISFGKKMDFLYNSIYNIYTNRKYQKYQHDLPMTYKEDVYKVYDNGLIFETNVSPSGRVDITSELLHKKGDIVYDENNEVVYQFKKGDNILDENGNPIIDLYSGIQRLMNVAMLEYEYFIAETESYKTYNNLVLDVIYDMAYNDMIELNNITLENTIIKYKSFRSIEDVKVDINNVTYDLPYSTTPIVTLYINKENEITTTNILEDYKSRCGKIISKHLNNSKIVLRDIKDEIMKDLGNIIKAVGIYNIDPNNSEVINIIGNNRFIINKKLEINEANLFTVKYDLDLKIQYV